MSLVQVDLFSKSLLLVPVHLEVHWCLVTADIVNKKICLYDSQGNALQKVARVIISLLYMLFLDQNTVRGGLFPECFPLNRTS